MEQKIKLATKCLYAAAAIHAGLSVYSMVIVFQANQSILDLAKQYPDSAQSLTSLSYGSSISFLSVLVIVGAILAAKELKEDKPWAWIGAIVVLLMAAPSWALPAAVVGLLALLDSRVRESYLQKLDISL